jgi:Pex14 N-terminal domain
MGEQGDSKSKPSIPGWQRSMSVPQKEATRPPDSAIEVARRFLDDDEVRHSSREKKTEFLRKKGLRNDEIETLLEEASSKATVEVRSLPSKHRTSSNKSQTTEDKQPETNKDSNDADTLADQKTTDRPPVITYPEFLTKPTRPPPLITPSGVMASLYAFTGLSSVLYGTSKYMVSPMVESLTEARHVLFDTTVSNLSKLIEKLEQNVSEIPEKKPKASCGADDGSDVEDPSEMFHRDIGTQTSGPTSPVLKDSGDRAAETESPLEKQLSTLTNMVERLQWIAREHVSQGEDLADIKTIVDALKDEVDQLASTGTVGANEWTSSWSVPKKEPDDEIKKARDNIRRVKGVMLSTRSFPARQDA